VTDFLEWLEEQEDAEAEALEALTGVARPDQVPGIIRIVTKHRSIFRDRYRASKYPHLSWESDEWDVRPSPEHRTEADKEIRKCMWKLRAGAGGSVSPMPSSFADVAKAWVVHTNVAPKSMSRYANATRYLWTVIHARLAKTSDGRSVPFTLVDWARVDEDDFIACESGAGAAGAKSESHSIANVAHQLKHFARWLHDNEICPALEYTPGVRKRNPSQKSTAEGKRARLDRMPTKTAIEGLGKIYWGICAQEQRGEALDLRDRVYIRAVGLLVIGGFRVSEVVSLPFDCLQSEEHGGRERVFLRYWNRKTRRRRAQWGRRWLSPAGVELAKRLVDEIKELTAEARLAALRLEQDPSSLPLQLNERVTVAEWAAVRGLTRDGHLAVLIADARRPPEQRRYPFYTPVGKGKKLSFARADVLRSLMEERGSLIAYNPGGGQKPQTLSESLFILRRGASWGDSRGDSPLLVDFLSLAAFTRWLCGGTNSGRRRLTTPSVFGRFTDAEGHAIREPHGGNVKIRPHMARHWLNTVANKAGMTAFQITLWMGRQDWRQTLFYLHDHADLADLLRNGIVEGTITGPAADTYSAMDEEDREAFLEGIEHAHKLTGGFCVATACECNRAKVCEDCPKALRTLGMESEMAARQERRAHAAAAIDVYVQLNASGRRVVPRLGEVAEAMVATLDGLVAQDLAHLQRRRVDG